MVKHVKLFENWAEENVELPELLDPSVTWLKGKKTVFHYDINYLIQNSYSLDLEDIDFRSFSDYDFWRTDYDKISIRQLDSDDSLKDCFGIPPCDKLWLFYTRIKSLKDLPDIKYKELTINFSHLENLKYVPAVDRLEIGPSPLLSYYAVSTGEVYCMENNICGMFAYSVSGYSEESLPTFEEFQDPQFNAGIFCNFEKIEYNWEWSLDDVERVYTVNPWINIYEDPNEVENYDFLFVPFYSNSEMFRKTAEKYLGNIDLSSVNRRKTDLW